MKVSVELQSDYLYFSDKRLANPSHATIPQGVTAVIGPNGAGKSMLADIVASGWNFRTNRISSPETERPTIKKIRFSDIHSLTGMKVEYYQQRYEATANDEIPTVADIIGSGIGSDQWDRLTALMNLGDVTDRRINFLSSGELRKLLIINIMLSESVDLLILDNPYIGLDSNARESLDNALKSLAETTSVMLLVADPKEIPPFADAILPIADMTLRPVIEGFESIGQVAGQLCLLFDYAVNLDAIPLPPSTDNEPLETVVDIRDISISYGTRTLIDNFSWTIRPGEHWRLAGPNGVGKSTILSLLTADNPRAYALDISLFGRRRGTGESIWDIKQRVGFLSPELALHFHPAGSVENIIAQGLNDTNGLYHRVTVAQTQLAWRWMDILHISHLAGRRWATLSSGEQQMVLLARVFIKQPRLMIFDEPFHALDYARKRAVRAIINYFAARSASTAQNRQSAPTNIILVSHYDDESPECLTHFMTLSPTR